MIRRPGCCSRSWATVSTPPWPGIHDVSNNQVGGILVERFDAFFAARCFCHLVARTLENSPCGDADICFIIDNQYSGHFSLVQVSFLEDLPPAFARSSFVRWVVDFVFEQMPTTITLKLVDRDEPKITIVFADDLEFTVALTDSQIRSPLISQKAPI